MAVKVDDSYGTVLAVYRAEKRKGDGVVASKCDHARKCFAMFRGTGLVGMRVGSPAQQEVVALLNLLKSICVVIPEYQSSIASSFPRNSVEKR